jgi:hypothetical protein
MNKKSNETQNYLTFKQHIVASLIGGMTGGAVAGGSISDLSFGVVVLVLGLISYPFMKMLRHNNIC